MSDKIMDVRSCIDAAVSPRGLEISGGGGGGASHALPQNLNPQSNERLELLNPASATWCIVEYNPDDYSEVGELSFNMALEVKTALTSDLANTDGYIELVQFEAIYPFRPSALGLHFCVNGTNGKNYLGKFYINKLYLKYTEDIPVGTILIIDTTSFTF